VCGGCARRSGPPVSSIPLGGIERHLRHKPKVIESGPFKGKRITCARAQRIKRLSSIAERFMLDVFEMPPTDYAISDESELSDFNDFCSPDTSEAWHRIGELYGLYKDDVGSKRLIVIFTIIAALPRSG